MNKMNLRSQTTGESYTVDVFEKDENIIVRHSSLEQIFWGLKNRPNMRFEIPPINNLPMIPPMYAMKCIMEGDGFYYEAYGEFLCEQWQISNTIAKYNPLAICQNRAFDKAFLRYMQFDISQLDAATIYSSAEIQVEDPDDAGCLSSNEFARHRGDKAVSQLNSPMSAMPSTFQMNNSELSMPDVPQMDVPEAPAVPTVPQMNIPVTPPVTATSQTGVPEAPAVPTVPQMNIPVTPPVTATSQTGVPEAPAVPTVPQMNIPGTPVVPTVPQMNIPEVPVVPTVPQMSIPEIPVVPTVPQTDIPEAPVVPTVPQMSIPEIPVVPTVPQMSIPEIPVVPTVPQTDIPETPVVPDSLRLNDFHQIGLSEPPAIPPISDMMYEEGANLPLFFDNPKTENGKVKPSVFRVSFEVEYGRSRLETSHGLFYYKPHTMTWSSESNDVNTVDLDSLYKAASEMVGVELRDFNGPVLP